MSHSMFLPAMLLAAAFQIKAPQLPLNPYSIAEDYQRLQSVRLLDDTGAGAAADDCDRYEVQLWRALDIPLRPDNGFGGVRSSCVADVMEIDWDRDPIRDVMLRIGPPVLGNHRHLLFRTRPDTFEYLGYIDAFGLESPDVRVIPYGDRSFLEDASGNRDVRSPRRDRTWWEVGKTASRPVFSYSAKGNVQTQDISRDWEARVIQVSPDSGVIKLELRTSYFLVIPGQAWVSLFMAEDEAVYRWSSITSSFEFDAAASTLGKEELEYTSGDRAPGASFVEWYLPELSRLAGSGSAVQKQWLRNWLEAAPDSQEKQHLIEILR